MADEKKKMTWRQGEVRSGSRWNYSVTWNDIVQGKHVWGGENDNGIDTKANKSSKTTQHQKRLPDVVILDRCKYHVNAGSVLRHLPIFFGRSYLFLTDSQRTPGGRFGYTPEERKIAFPPPENGAGRGPFDDKHGKILTRGGYGASFFKEAVRISQAERRKAFDARLIFETEEGGDARRPGENGVDLAEALEFLRKKGYVVVACENVEALRAAAAATNDDASGNPKNMVIDSLWDSAVLRDVDRPVAFVFGSENMSLPFELVKAADAGIYIPSAADDEFVEAVDESIDNRPGKSDSRERERDSSCKRKATHTFNLSCATSVVLSARAQHLWNYDGQQDSTCVGSREEKSVKRKRALSF